jgi:hypothetical protein
LRHVLSANRNNVEHFGFRRREKSGLGVQCAHQVAIDKHKMLLYLLEMFATRGIEAAKRGGLRPIDSRNC